jgi:hypothetical protein
VDAINDRQRNDFRLRGALVEWQTQQLARVIASTVPVAKGKKNPLEKLVASISLWPEDEDRLPGELPAGREPSRGSTERFMGMFGAALEPPR